MMVWTLPVANSDFIACERVYRRVEVFSGSGAVSFAGAFAARAPAHNAGMDVNPPCAYELSARQRGENFLIYFFGAGCWL